MLLVDFPWKVWYDDFILLYSYWKEKGGGRMRGQLHLYTGNGKGKSTALAGMALRGAGNGLPVWFVQFLKTSPSGEVSLLGDVPGITVLRPQGSGKFTWEMTAEEKESMAHTHGLLLEQAFEEAHAHTASLILLDEALDALELGLLDEKLVQALLLHHQPYGAEIAFSGRRAPKWLEEIADYHTEMQKKKHPFDQGLPARQGVEW